MEAFKSKISLIISIFIVFPIGIVYGFMPELLFNIDVNTTDEHSVFKAIMGIYLSFAIIWIIGIFKNEYFQIALFSNFVFMFGLAFGRIISIIFDGIPSKLFVFGLVGELFLGYYSYMIWRKLVN